MVKRLEDLVAWQLSQELCGVVYEITAEGKPAADGHFQDQIRRAAKAAPSLIAEGFVRFTAPEMVRYLRMARAELAEVQSDLAIGGGCGTSQRSNSIELTYSPGGPWVPQPTC